MDILSLIIYSVILFWSVKQAKNILFWVYLWQLKDYHWGRFAAHFSTAKGRSLLLNRLLFAKILLACFFYAAFCLDASLWWGAALFFLYFFESAHAGYSLVLGRSKKPVSTAKALFLSSAAVAFVFSFLLLFFFFFGGSFQFLFCLLIIDILSPVVISAVVLFFQPLTVLLRTRTIAKAKAKRRQFKDLKVVGITGSCGKSSAKEFLATILQHKYRVLRTPKNQNSEMGISRTILKYLTQEYQIFVCEMGGYDISGIKLLADIAQPQMGVLVSVNQQHLATFGSQENITKGKFKLIESLPEDGKAILNWDNEFIKKELRSRKFKVKNIKLYSAKSKEGVDVWADNIQLKRDKVIFDIFSRDGEFASFKIDLPGGMPIVLNVLAAATAAKGLGMSLSEVGRACQKLDPRFAPVLIRKGIDGINIIDSSYSSNPEGVLADLDYSSLWIGKKIVVMPSLIELGKAAKEVHKNIGQRIGKICDLAIITSKDGVKEIKAGALSGGLDPAKIMFIEDPKKIVEKIKTELRRGDAILLEGRVPQEVSKLLEEKK